MKQKKSIMTMLCLGLIMLLAGSVYAQSITVTVPASGANWVKGTSYTITWTKSGAQDANVKLRLFDSTGVTMIVDITSSTPNDGSYPWTVPNSVAPGNYVMRVKTVDNAVFDDSGVFAITNPVAPAGTLTVTSPAAGGQWCKGSAYNITWNKSGEQDGNVKIRLYDSTATTVIQAITDSTPNNGSFSWTVPDTLTDGNYIMRVRTVDNAVFDDSGVFQIKVCGGSGGIPDWGRIKDILEGLREIQWWRNRPPKFPWPNPCLSCPPEFDLGKIREHLERAGLKERIRVELFGQDGKISDLGVFGKGLSFGKSLRMKQIGQRQSELLQGGKGFKLVFRNMAGEIVHTQAINMKEMDQGVR